MMHTGLLITIEGLDGSGKSTIAQALYHELIKNYPLVVLTKEPGGSSLGRNLRELVQHQTVSLDPRSEFLLFAADRAQHMKEIVIPTLKKGGIAISDRMAESSLAYQGYGRGLDLAMINSVNSWVMDGITPDLILYPRVDVRTAIDRVHARGQKLTSFERQRHDFFERVKQGYESIFAQRSNVITLDAQQPLDILVTNALAEVLAWIQTNRHS